MKTSKNQFSDLYETDFSSLENLIPDSNPTCEFSPSEAIEISLTILDEIESTQDFKYYSDIQNADWILGPLLYCCTLPSLELPFVSRIITLFTKWLFFNPPGKTEEEKNKYVMIGIIFVYHLIKNYTTGPHLLQIANAIQQLIEKPPINIQNYVWKQIGKISAEIVKHNSNELNDFIASIFSAASLFVIDTKETIEYFNIMQESVLQNSSLVHSWCSLFAQILSRVLLVSKSDQETMDFNKCIDAVLLKSMLKQSSKLSANSLSLCQQCIASALDNLTSGNIFRNRWSIDQVLSIFGRILITKEPQAKNISPLMSIISGGTFETEDWHKVIISFILRNVQSQNIELPFEQIGQLYEVICYNTNFFMKFGDQILNALTRLDSNYIAGNSPPYIYAFLRSFTAIFDSQSPGIFSRKNEEIAENKKIRVIDYAVTNLMWLTQHQSNNCHQLLLAINTFDPINYIKTLDFMADKKDEQLSFAYHITASLTTFDPAFFNAITLVNDFPLFLIEQISKIEDVNSTKFMIPLMHLLYEIAENTSLFDYNLELRTSVNMFSIRSMKNSENKDIKEYAMMLLFSVSAQKKMNMSTRAANEVEKNFKGHIGYFQLNENLISILTDDSDIATIIIRNKCGIISYKLSSNENTKDVKHQNMSITEEDIKSIPHTGIFTDYKSNLQTEGSNKDISILVKLGLASADNFNHLFPLSDPKPLIEAYNQKMFCSTSIGLFRVTSSSQFLRDITTSMTSSPAFERFLCDISSEMLLQTVDNIPSKLPLPIGFNGSFKYSFLTPSLFLSEGDNETSQTIKTIFQLCKKCEVQLIFNESSSILLPIRNPPLQNTQTIIEIRENSKGLYCVRPILLNYLLPSFLSLPALMTPSQLKLYIDVIVSSTAKDCTFSEKSRHSLILAEPLLRKDTSIRPLLEYLLNSPVSSEDQ